MNIVLKSDKTLYIRLPKEELEETRKIQSTVQLATLIKLQNSLDINLASVDTIIKIKPKPIKYY